MIKRGILPFTICDIYVEDLIMQKLLLLYFGTIFLMYLSQVTNPVRIQLQGYQRGRYHFMLGKSDIFMGIVIFWLSAFSFLRTSYNDAYTYISTFRTAETVAEGLANGTFTDWTGNPWSMFYRSLLHDLTDNYHIYFFFPAVMSSFAVVKLFKRYSLNPAFSLLIFFSIGTYIMYVAALKQCLAMFFLLMALPYAIDRKYLRFYLLVLVAIMFHTHAFMFAIVPLLLEKPWGKVTWGLLGATIFAMVTYDVIGILTEIYTTNTALLRTYFIICGQQKELSNESIAQLNGKRQVLDYDIHLNKYLYALFGRVDGGTLFSAGGSHLQARLMTGEAM